ncbi:cytochrome P450 [Acephala macrosclerotiorum]|nr:cytochrome P450 [Acephala macrosclerotiorum]
MVILDDLSTRGGFVLVLALAAIIVYPIYLTVYRLFFSPLSKIPGPWPTRISGILEGKALKEQRRTSWVGDLFAENPGAIAIRTNPNSVSFNHPDAVKAIYGHGKGVEGFGKSSDQMMEKFMQKMDHFSRTQEPFDIYFWFELFTMDLMGELALGNNFGAIEAGKPARCSTLVEQSQRFANFSGILPFGKSNVKVLSWVPLPKIRKLQQARLEYLDFARQALEKRFQDNRKHVSPDGKARQDIMQRFIEARDLETGHKMDFVELRAETSSLMHDTTMNPEVRTRIIKELEETFPDNTNGVQPISFTKLQKLCLLENAEIECLRLHPPLGYAMPRDTPPQGAVICGHYIPGGVAVGVPAAIIGRNANVYRNPDNWDPDRWTDETADLATMKTCFLGFGFGSRQCIGRNVANQFVMKMIATLLLRYEIRLEDPSLVLGTKEFTIQKPDQKYNVILEPRGT